MSDLVLGVTVGGAAQAVSDLQRVGQATTQTAGAAQQAAQQTSSFGSSARDVAQHVQGMASQVAALSSRLGGGAVGQAAGLVGSLAGVTTQAISMGATMGPGGAVVGAISGLIPLLADLMGANESVSRATIDLTDDQHNFTLSITGSGGALEAIDRLVNAQRAYAQARGRTERIQQGLGSVEEQYAAAELAGQRVGALRVQLQQVRAQIAQEDAESSGHSAALEQQRVDLIHQINEAHLESQRLGELAVQTEHEELEIQTDLLTTANEHATITERHASAAHSVATHMHQAAISAEAAARSEQTFIQEMMHAAGTDSMPGLGFGEAASDDMIAQLADRQATAQTRAASSARSLAAAHRELAATARPTNNALQSVADTVGGTVTNAFKSAVGAWLDGSKSFVQAAEEMAKGVIKALVTEAIVQGVVELARGIADLASYRYDSAGAHFAAAAAWAAVGVVAGTVGAAVGAFGGGGADKGSAGATTRDTANARDQRESQGGGNTTLYVYPGGYITKKDVTAGMIDALNEGARSGMQLDPRIVRRAA